MTSKKIMLLAIFVVSLFAISAVSAADNLTDDVVSVDLENNAVEHIDDVNVNDESYNSTGSQDILAVGENDVLSASSPPASYYKVNIYDTSFSYGSGGSVTMYITPCTNSNYYKYDFYFRVYDDSNSIVIENNFYSTSSSSTQKYNFNAGQLTPGKYTMKIENYYDSKVMSTATLTVKQNEIDSYDSTFSSFSNTVSSASSYLLINLYNNISTNSYFNSISISKTLTIDGHGNTLDAKGYNRVFSISGTNVILKNIKFKNAYCSVDGGAIYWSGSNGKLINCTFENNKAGSSYSGGAVYLSGSGASISDCKFINGSAYYGGAVYLGGSSSTITDCEFILNSASGEGGALYITRTSTIKNSNFTNNTAGYGGAIAIGNTYTVNMNGCNFNNNSADFGSAIKWYSSLGTVTNCTFNGTKTNSHKYMYISSRLSPYYYITANDIELDEKLNLTINWSNDLQENMTIDIFSNRLNKTVYSKVEQLNGLINSINLLIPDLKAGDYTINAIYSGDNIYYGKTITSSFKVIGKLSDINFDVSNITWGSPVVLNPKVTAGATGSIEIYLNGEYVDTISVGSKYNLMGAGGPSSQIKLVYLGDDTYRSCQSIKTVNVERLVSSVTLPEKFVSGYSTVEIVFNQDATGKVTISFAGSSYSGNLADGRYKFNTGMVSSGTKTLSISYNGDSKYQPMSLSYSVDVEMQVPTLLLNIANVETGKDVIVQPVLSGGTGNYRIYVDNKYVTTISTYQSYTINRPSLGKHNVRVVYSGDSYYASVENTTAFRVYSFIPIKVENTNIIYNTDNYLKATFYDEYGHLLSNKPVIFNVNGTDYYRYTDENGVAVLDEKLKMGKYNVMVVNSMVNEALSTTLTVFTSINSKDMTVYHNSGYDFTATFLDNNANPLTNSIVLFNVNGKLYNAKTDGYGQAKLIVPLPAGNYVITSINPETDESATNKLTVINSINSQDMSRAYNSQMDYKATFYNVDGTFLTNKLVAFEIGDKRYDVTTDSSGQAILNVGLAKGEYYITSINPVTNQKSVNKLTILERIINNNDVVVYGDEATYYRVRVIDNNAVVCGAGQTVTFTLSGERSDVKTASDGYASLRITKPAGSYTVTASYMGYTVQNKVTVLDNVASVLTLTSNNINYGQKETLTLNINQEYLQGNVSVTVKGANGYEKVFNQRASKTIVNELSALNASTYQVTAIYSDFDNFHFARTTNSFTVSKTTPEIILTCEGEEYGKNSTVSVNLQQASGHVTLKVGDRTYGEDIVSNGVVVKKFSDLSPGKYTVSVSYDGNNNFNRASKTASFEVLRGSVEFYADVSNVIYGQDVIANVYSSHDGKVTLKIGDSTRTVNIVADNEVSVNFGKLNAGRYSLNANIAPLDKNYNSVTDNLNVEVEKSDISLEVKAENIELGQATKITVSLPQNLNANIKLQLDGRQFTQSSVDSKATFNIAGLALGEYSPKVEFDGNANYNAASETVTFEVQKIKSINTIIPNTVSNIDYEFVCFLSHDASGNLTVSINGNDCIADVVNGKVNIQLPKLDDGSYQYNLYYSGDSKYAEFYTSGTLKISKTTVKSGDANIFYGTGFTFKTTFINTDGTPLANSDVSFVVNGKIFQSKTDSNGVANLNVNLGNGVYDVSCINSKTGDTSTANLKINGGTNTTVLTASKISTTYNSGKKLTVTLKDIFDKSVAGVPVSVNVGGTVRFVVTNSNGQAEIDVSNFVPKTYQTVVSFAGDNRYSSSSVDTTVSVQKLTPKLTASKKTFKVKTKVKKYTITLKTNNNKVLTNEKVTIKIKGKTYSAKTNSKGKATFKLSKLTKKGTFSSTVKYGGNSYYKSVSKKVKIILK